MLYLCYEEFNCKMSPDFVTRLFLWLCKKYVNCRKLQVFFFTGKLCSYSLSTEKNLGRHKMSNRDIELFCHNPYSNNEENAANIYYHVKRIPFLNSCLSQIFVRWQIKTYVTQFWTFPSKMSKDIFLTKISLFSLVLWTFKIPFKRLKFN